MPNSQIQYDSNHTIGVPAWRVVGALLPGLVFWTTSSPSSLGAVLPRKLNGLTSENLDGLPAEPLERLRGRTDSGESDQMHAGGRIVRRDSAHYWNGIVHGGAII